MIQYKNNKMSVKNNMFKKPFSLFLIFSLLVILLNLVSLSPASAEDNNKIIFYWGQGCPHCAKVEKYIQENNLSKYFDIESREIYFNKKNRQEFLSTCQKYNIPLDKEGVPLALINNQCIIGDQPIINALKAKLESAVPQSATTSNEQQNAPPGKGQKLTLPLVLGAASVDAVNPCAFAVLIILMTTILASNKRKRALFAGLSFALAIYISYLLMGLGVYKALATAKFSSWFIKAIGSLAILMGLLNLKDYIWYGGGGFVMEVPRKWRPKMKALIHSVTSPIGAFLIGFLVSLFLLPCTSGPYIVILGMLSQKTLFASALLWLILYNAIFILPMIIITIAVYFGLNPQKAEKAREKQIKLLHLIAAILMIAIGIIVLLNIA